MIITYDFLKRNPTVIMIIHCHYTDEIFTTKLGNNWEEATKEKIFYEILKNDNEMKTKPSL